MGSGPGSVVAAPAPPSVAGAGSVVVNNDDASPAGAPAVDDEVGDDESGSPTADD